MKYNFDIIVDRSQNHKRKWDKTYINSNYYLQGPNVINSSIVDLDFVTPVPISLAIQEWALKSVYSYIYISTDLYTAIKNLYQTEHHLKIDVEKIKLVHGTVNALHQLAQGIMF